MTKAAVPKRQAFPVDEKIKHKKAQETSKKQIDISYYVPLVKVLEDKQQVTGIVLQPDVVDAQGDLIPENVVVAAAHKFLAVYNKKTKLGEQHSIFKSQFDLLESYTAPVDMTLENKMIKKGTWIMVVKVLQPEVWERVKAGKINGFSIGGTAKAEQIQEKESEM